MWLNELPRVPNSLEERREEPEIGAASGVMPWLCQYVTVKKALRQKEKLLDYLY